MKKSTHTEKEINVFILRQSLRAFFFAVISILLIEASVFCFFPGSNQYATDFFEYSYEREETLNDVLIYLKIRDLTKKEAEIFSIGGSPGTFGLQPKIVMSHLNNMRFINLSTAALLGFTGYKKMAEIHLKNNPKAKILVLYLSPFTITSAAAQNNNKLNVRIHKNFVSFWKNFYFPILNWRLAITNFIYYGQRTNKPFKYDQHMLDTEGNPVPYTFSEWENLLPQTDGWLPYLDHHIKEDKPCDVKNGDEIKDNVLKKELDQFSSFAKKNNLKFAVVFNPVHCEEFGVYSDSIQMQLDQFAFENRDVFIPFDAINTWPTGLFNDINHLSEEGSIVNSNRVGKAFKRWFLSPAGANYYQDAMLRQKGNSLEGLIPSFYPNGTVKSLRNYENGKLHGVAKSFFPDKKLMAERSYVHGKLEGRAIKYYENGAPQEIRNFENDVETGESRLFFKNGVLRIVENYKNDKRNGISRLYNENGILLEETIQSDNKIHGIGKFFYPNGKVKIAIPYRRGLRHGTGIMYSPDGKIISTQEFKHDKLIQGQS